MGQAFKQVLFPQPLWISDSNGEVQKLTGREHFPESLRLPQQLPFAARELIHPSDLEKYRRLLRRAVLQKEGRALCEELRLINGAWVIVSSRGASETSSKAESEPDVVVSTCTDISRQKKLESFLFASEERFALSVSGSLDGIWDWKLHTGELYCSRRFCQLLGYERSAFRRVQKQLFSLLHPKDRWKVLRTLSLHLQRKGSFDIEFRASHQNKGMRWYRAKGQAIWNHSSGRAERMAGSLTDITENKRLRSKLQSKIDSVNREAVTIELDLQGRVLSANHRFFQLMELTEGSLMGSLFNDWLAKDPIDFKRSAVVSCHSREFEMSSNVPGSSGCVLRGALSPMIDEDGEVFRLSFFGFDVTEKHLAERALASETAFRRAVLDSAAGLVITTDPAGLITMANQQALRWAGLAEQDIVGQCSPAAFLRGFPGGDPHGGSEDAFRNWVRGMSAGEIRTAEASFAPTRDADEEVSVQLLLSVSKVETASAKALGYVLIGQDISELKRVERLKSDFVSTVSHELRTPLTSIAGALKLVEAGAAGSLSQKGQTLLGVAGRNTDRLIALIGDLLDIQKIEAGQLTFEMGFFDVKEWVEGNLAVLETYASEKSVQMLVAGLEQSLLVWGDRGRLTQVLQNLLSNAVKFSPQNGRVLVEIVPSEAGVEVRVIDEGPGVPPAFRERIFEKFSQADSADSREKGGTGLGLAIAQEIVRSHGSEIRLASFPGQKGACFVFDLPRDPQSAKAFERAVG